MTTTDLEVSTAFAEAAQRWPGVGWPHDAFARACVEGSPEAAHLVEFYLARACVAGDAVAQRAFDAQVLGAVTPTLKRLMRDEAHLEELLQLVRVRLLVGERPRLAEYGGRGSLAGWVKAVATRLGLNELKAQLRVEQREEPVEVLPEAELVGDPAVRALRERHQADFRAALEAGWAGLDDQQRSVLQLHTIDRASIDVIGAIYGVHRVTASRWVDKARAALLQGTRAALAARLRLTDGELESLLRVVGSQVDLSIRTLFAS